jgi:hypothetical protein
MRSQRISLQQRIAALEDMRVDLIARLCELDRLRQKVRKLELNSQRGGTLDASKNVAGNDRQER